MYVHMASIVGWYWYSVLRTSYVHNDTCNLAHVTDTRSTRISVHIPEIGQRQLQLSNGLRSGDVVGDRTLLTLYKRRRIYNIVIKLSLCLTSVNAYTY